MGPRTKVLLDGVLDLYPGADRQSLQCLAELLDKDVSELERERDEARRGYAGVDALYEEATAANAELSRQLIAAKRQLEAAREALEEISNNCDPEDPPWHNSEEGRHQTGDIARAALAQTEEGKP